MGNRTNYSFEGKDSLFIRKNINSGEASQQCKLASLDLYTLWHKSVGHINFENIFKLPDYAT